MSENKKTITICSSASFYKDVLVIARKIKQLGFKVAIPKTANKMKESGNFNVADYKTWFTNQDDYKKKTKLIDSHFKKIVESDAILVVNNKKHGISGYIGGNTLMEMALAHYFKKKIFIWNDIDSDLAFEEEVKGLNPIFIQQDLSRIKI